MSVVENKISEGARDIPAPHYDANAAAEDILRQAIEKDFAGRIAVISSFGAEAVVLLRMVSQIDPTTPIIFLNTDKLFPETLRYRDRLQASLGLTDIRSIAPHPDDVAALDPKGGLWRTNTDACCHIRKVLPQARAVQGFDALITGRKRFQTQAREVMDIAEQDNDGRWRVNPLANWSLDELRAYIEKYNLPRHPLVKDGFLSIGCTPCTDRVKEGGNYRDGRWSDSDKDECGIHTNIDGDGI